MPLGIIFVKSFLVIILAAMVKDMLLRRVLRRRLARVSEDPILTPPPTLEFLTKDFCLQPGLKTDPTVISRTSALGIFEINPCDRDPPIKKFQKL